MQTGFLLAGLLGASLVSHAQAIDTTVPATAYQVQHDSLWARAQRVRTQLAANTVYFRTSFVGIMGTRRAVVCLGYPVNQGGAAPGPRIVLLKREVVKHKTRGAEVKKVTYYGTGGARRLYEYYEDGNLVQLELYNYPTASGTGSYNFATMRWLRGDYLSVSQRSRTATGGRLVQEQAFTNPSTAPN